MKNSIIISILTAVIICFFASANMALIITACILLLASIAYSYIKPMVIYNYYKAEISNFKEDVSKPFVNPNKVSWKILMLIPNIDKMTAKHIAHNRRHFGDYKSLEDFFKINEIPEDKREKIKKYIII